MNIIVSHKTTFEATISSLIQAGVFNEIDRLFSNYIINLEEEYDRDYHILILTLSYCSLHSHSCYKLGSNPFTELEAEIDDSQQRVAIQQFISDLLAIDSLVRFERLHTVGDGSNNTAVVIVHNRIYLYKYFYYERYCAQKIVALASARPTFSKTEVLQAAKPLFTSMQGDIDWQHIAAVNALLSNFSLVTGGPGTGKTTTIFKIVLLFKIMYGVDSNIILTAPTGKAAARMQSALTGAIDDFIQSNSSYSDYLDNLTPLASVTVHRLLTSIMGNKQNKTFVYDLIIIDESSMLQLSLFYKLLKNIHSGCTLIMLGDKDQLTSVGTGSLLADLCTSRSEYRYSKDFGTLLSEFNYKLPLDLCNGKQLPVQDQIVYLTKSYRFDDASGIGNCARAIRHGDSDLFFKTCQDYPNDVLWLDVQTTQNSLTNALLTAIAFIEKTNDNYQYGDFVTKKTPLEMINSLSRTMILCAIKKSEFGVLEVNKQLADIVSKRYTVNKKIMATPFLNTKNSYNLNLYNGDVGIVTSEDDKRYFYKIADDTRSTIRVNCSVIPNLEKAFAMTIHKSQGSEYDNIIIILPDKLYPILSRELFYTALTRAKKRVVVLASEKVVRYTCQSRIERMSGLAEFL